jgi:hypothetical protein
MKQTVKSAFLATLPVLTGYLVLGFGFGIVLRAEGGSILLAAAMSTTPSSAPTTMRAIWLPFIFLRLFTFFRWEE